MTEGNRSAVLISCTNHYRERMYVMEEYLQRKGYRTVYITSDFDHNSKKNYRCDVPGCVQLPTKPYRRNLSVTRILSHRKFARDVYAWLEQLEQKPDLIVSEIPPNFLCHYLAKYKRKHPDCKLIFDIFDLWPETFPSGRMKKLLLPVFSVWAWIRDHSLPVADFVVCECEMFREKLGLAAEKSAAIYLTANAISKDLQTPQLREDALDICYLGAINNIIDIPRICDLLSELSAQRPVTLHIIGKGERQQKFVDQAKAAGASVEFYGAVYDPQRKLEIMNRCHFGLNIMKPSVCVGLTMKSVDYFRFGLPLINSIPADTERLVRQENIGIQLGADCGEKLLSLSLDQMLQMRQNVKKVFDSIFERKTIDARYAQIFDGLL